MELSLQKSLELLNKHIQNQNLKRHCLAVGYTLSAFFDYYKDNNIDTGALSKEQWQIIGTLHDADWEITATNHEQHTLLLIEWLKEYELSNEFINVFKSHNTKTTHLREPETLLEWTLECCDELTGFIVSVTLIQPTKKLQDVKVESITKKLKQKEFSKAVSREQISQCKEKLNIELEKFIEITLSAMQKNAQSLGL